jgi:glycosyltransferase involved in cell wall biosynthesis
VSAQKRYNVLFVTPTLGCGGAERLLVQLLRLADRGTFTPMLAVLNKRGDFVNQVPEDVPVFDLAKRSRYSFFALQRRISGMVRRLDIDLVVSFISYTNYMVLMSRALFGWKAPVIACLHTTLSPSLPSQRFSRLKKLLVRRFYPKAEAVVTVSEGAKRDLIEVTSLPENKIHVIYNAVEPDAIRSLAQEPLDHDRSHSCELVAVGRLTAAKDYATLLKAFQIVRRTSDAHLTIIGEGEERPRLERLRRELDLDACVTFLGFTSNPYKYVARASVFVLSSAWEGFSIAVLEAMTCGTPVVSTDCPSGPSEIITDGENGLLVPVGDQRSLAAAVTRLLGDDDLREKLSKAGKRRSEDFGVEKVTREYESLMLEVAGANRRLP